MKKKQASSMIYIIVFLSMFFAFAAFAIDGTIVLANRAKLQNATEMAALTAASQFNYSTTATNAQIQSKVIDTAKSTFKLLRYGGLDSVNVDNPSHFLVDVDVSAKEVTVTSNMLAPPFFLSFFGVTGVEVQAKAKAGTEPLDVMANYSGINWITSSAAYRSDILSKGINLNDTAILLPVGDFKSASYDTVSKYVKFNLIEADSATTAPLSLGPGGFITIKLPTPIIDKPGADLYIKESGIFEGYMVFAGLDNDPEQTIDNSATTGPYVQYDKPGKGISWINISCSGEPEATDTSGRLGAYTISTDGLGIQARFFGSGYFDLGDSCIGDISMAKYIRIVDDNNETGFVTSNGSTYYKATLYGEASTATSGADITSVKVLNHVKLK